MSRITIEATERTAADAAAVYTLLRTGATWPDWSPIDSFELEREGAGEPEGIGAVRILRNGRITGHDEITGFTENRSFRYAHRSALPVRDYRGEIDLTPADGGGTVIHWQVSFQPKIPGTGWLLRRALTTFIGELTSGLARHAATAGDRSAG